MAQPKYLVKSLNTALSIFELLISEGRYLSLAEISSQLDIGKGTVHRILATFRSRGFVQQDPDTRKYGFGIRMLEISSKINRESFIRSIMYPTLKELFHRCDETVNAAVLESNEVKYIIRFEPDRHLKVSFKEGTRLPAHTTAIGKVMLSLLSNEQLKKIYPRKSSFKRLAKNSIGSMEELLNELKKVRKKGLAYDYEEAIYGVHCVAIPVPNTPNGLVVALGVSAPKVRMTNNKIREFSPLLIEAAEKISNRFSP